MIATKILFNAITVLGLVSSALAAPPGAVENSEIAARGGPNGARFCVGGGISCEYPKGRCAVLCPSGQCSCPSGQDDNPYTGAACIPIFTAANRYQCTTDY